MTTGKTTALTRWTFAGKVMSLLFNMLSRLVTTFLPRSKRLLISCVYTHTHTRVYFGVLYFLFHWSMYLVLCQYCTVLLLVHVCSVMSDSLWPHGHSPPGSSVREISQARILEWVAISYSSQLRDWTHICVFCISREIYYHWATWGAILLPTYL